MIILGLVLLIVGFAVKLGVLRSPTDCRVRPHR
jgi:hypothetical protein